MLTAIASEEDRPGQGADTSEIEYPWDWPGSADAEYQEEEEPDNDDPFAPDEGDLEEA